MPLVLSRVRPARLDFEPRAGTPNARFDYPSSTCPNDSYWVSKGRINVPDYWTIIAPAQSCVLRGDHDGRGLHSPYHFELTGSFTTGLSMSIGRMCGIGLAPAAWAAISSQLTIWAFDCFFCLHHPTAHRRRMPRSLTPKKLTFRLRSQAPMIYLHFDTGALGFHSRLSTMRTASSSWRFDGFSTMGVPGEGRLGVHMANHSRRWSRRARARWVQSKITATRRGFSVTWQLRQCTSTRP